MDVMALSRERKMNVIGYNHKMHDCTISSSGTQRIPPGCGGDEVLLLATVGENLPRMNKVAVLLSEAEGD